MKHYSIRTEQAYTDWIKRFIQHFGKKHQRNMGAAEVEQFLTHLTVNGQVSNSEAGLGLQPRPKRFKTSTIYKT